MIAVKYLGTISHVHACGDPGLSKSVERVIKCASMMQAAAGMLAVQEILFGIAVERGWMPGEYVTSITMLYDGSWE